jgi:hypothetical protein
MTTICSGLIYLLHQDEPLLVYGNFTRTPQQVELSRKDEHDLQQEIKEVIAGMSSIRCDKPIDKMWNERDLTEKWLGLLGNSIAGHVGNFEPEHFLYVLVRSEEDVVEKSITQDPLKARDFTLKMKPGAQPPRLINGQHRKESLRRSYIHYITAMKDIDDQLKVEKEERAKAALMKKKQEVEKQLATHCQWSVIVYSEGECIRLLSLG